MREFIISEDDEFGGWIEMEFDYIKRECQELIRCKNCKYWERSSSDITGHTCHWGYFKKDENDFCSWAERRNEHEND